MGSRIIAVSLAFAFIFGTACAADPGVRRFLPRPPMTVDNDTRPVRPPCDAPDSAHCMPEPYVSPQAWDIADNSLFRPLSELFALPVTHEAVNVNSLDEVPDSAWFENRPVDAAELERGPCATADLDPDDPDGSWLIDLGKPNGATPGFRVTARGRRFMFKVDPAEGAERGEAAAVIGARLYHAAGFHVPCDRILEVRPKVFAMKPGLQSVDNLGIAHPFDRAALGAVLAKGLNVEGRVRVVASEWIPGVPIGPFRYEGTRDDDPNDVIRHQDRRELRGSRLLAAWMQHFDAREQNTLDSWIAAPGAARSGSPGHVRHYVIDFSDSFGSDSGMDGIDVRHGHSYYLDLRHVGADFFSFGAVERPWDRAERSREAPIFGYFSARDFDPEKWHNGYPNPAFDRMTERDGAWMARKIARIGLAELHAIVAHGRLAPAYEAYLQRTLLARQRAVLRRYLGRLSPLADATVGEEGVCAVNLARRSGAFSDRQFSYRAVEGARLLPVTSGDDGRVCVALDHGRGYRVVTIYNGVAPGGLEVHLYDQGPGRGYLVAGLVR